MLSTSPIRIAGRPVRLLHIDLAAVALAASLLAAPGPGSAEPGAPAGAVDAASAASPALPHAIERAETPYATQARAIDLGTPSVLSQRGQRLRIAIPFGSTPGDRVSATRFTVAAVAVPAGHDAPLAEGFTVLRPERRNVVILQSREPMLAPSVALELRVEGQPSTRLDVAVPPARYADMTTTAGAIPAPPAARDAAARRAAPGAARARPPQAVARPGRGRNTATSS